MSTNRRGSVIGTEAPRHSVVACEADVPISYSFDRKSGITVVSCSGVLTAADITQNWDEIYTDAKILDGGSILIDMRRAKVDVSKEEFVRLATKEWPAEATGRLVMAVVVSTPEQFDAARQFQLLAREGSEHQISFNLGDARAWLSRRQD